MSTTTDYLGGWAFANLGGGLDWTTPENAGSEPDGSYAIVSTSGTSKFLTGGAGAPDFEIPDGSTIDRIDVRIRFGPTGAIFGGSRPMAVALFDGVNLSDGQLFDIGDIAPGNTDYDIQLTPAEWGMTEHLVTWLAAPSLAIQQAGTGQGVPRVDAVTARVVYTAAPPAAVDGRIERNRSAERMR